jgi:hypothetical protein
MEKKRLPRPAMLVLAALFLIEAWVWDAFVWLARRLVSFIPWATFKARVAAFIDVLPAPVVLVVYLVPFIVVEPLKFITLWIAATGHVIFGLVGFVLVQFVGVGLLAVVFDLTREKLLSMAWFAWIYEKVLVFHHFADELIAPYKAAAKREWQAMRAWARAYRERLRGAPSK